jgi:hypothetical protein
MTRNLTSQDEFNISAVALRLGISPIWLKRVIWVESKNDPAVVNSIGATGLIQFTKSTADWIGTTTAKLKGMSFAQQMEWVYIYFNKIFKSTGKPLTEFDLYCCVFQPAFVNKSDSVALSNNAYAANKGIDANKDGKITKGEVRAWYYRQAASTPGVPAPTPVVLSNISTGGVPVKKKLISIPEIMAAVCIAAVIVLFIVKVK